MAKVVFNNAFLLRRAYKTVAAENVQSAATSVIRKVTDLSNKKGGGIEGIQKDVFWMRDPKTGNWLPETHFDVQLDAVDLRHKFCTNKDKF